MRPVHPAEDVRTAEEEFFLANPSVDLMARASEAIAAAALRMLGKHQQVLVVVGPGNNGGDGLFAAASLARSGRRVHVWPTVRNTHAEGLEAAHEAGAIIVSASSALSRLPGTDLMIDAFTGISGRPGLPFAVAEVANACVARGVPILSVDIPSGLAADSHVVHESVLATRTVTFGALKPCHVLQPAASRCGVVEVADIGFELPAPRLLQVESTDLAKWWPVPCATDDKYTRGVLRMDTGSRDYPGAAIMGVLGATHVGAGMVRYVGPNRDLILLTSPSVVTQDGRSQAQVVGSGWGAPDPARLATAVGLGIPTVFDAEGLQALPATIPDNSLLTPHAGELARLLDQTRADVVADPIGATKRLAARHEACVLLKGATQYLANPDGTVWLAPPGPAWTAQAGSGDVLAGVAGALLAAGMPAAKAGVLAAGIQAATATANPGPRTPDELARRMPDTIAELTCAKTSTAPTSR